MPPKKTKDTVTVPEWRPFFQRIAQLYDEPLQESKVKELARNVLWHIQEIKFRIDMNKNFFFDQSTGGSARSSSSDDSTGPVPDHIHDIVERCINFPADDKPAAAKPAAAAQAQAIDLCSSSDSDNETTILPTRVAPKSNDRRETADTNKSATSLSSFAQRVAERASSTLCVLNCPNSTTKRSSPDGRPPTMFIRNETGAKNVNMKKSRVEGSDDGDQKPTANPDTNVSIDIAVAAEDTDPSLELPQEADLDTEKGKFRYEGDDDDEENTSPPLLISGAASKPSPLPMGLDRLNMIPILVAEMNGLNISLCMPTVKKEQLSHPEGQSRAKFRAIRGVLAQGKQFHDETIYPNYSQLQAKTVAFIVDTNDRLGNPFEIVRDDEKGILEGVHCKSCSSDLVKSILKLPPKKTGSFLKEHLYKRCREICSCCGLTANKMENDHDKWRYEEFYLNRLCKGEKELTFEDFIAAAKSHTGIPKLETFYPTGINLLNVHARQRDDMDKSYCVMWHECAAMFEDYVRKYGTDVIEKKNCDSSGLTVKQVAQMRQWVKTNYTPNEYGSFGVSWNNAFTGNRHAMIQSMHEIVRQKKTKGMKPLSSFFSKKK